VLLEAACHPHILGSSPKLDYFCTLQDGIQYVFQKEGQDNLSVFLTRIYRGHLSFLIMLSTLFYFDMLQGTKMTNVYSKQALRAIEALSTPVQMQEVELPPMLQPLKQSTWPIHFRGVIGPRRTGGTLLLLVPQTCGPMQKKQMLLLRLPRVCTKKGPFNSFDWCHGFFRAQVVLIRHLLRTFDLGGVNAGTIEDYQAVERDVIVVSLMRSNAAFVPNDVEHS
jgi:hypothetical protein